MKQTTALDYNDLQEQSLAISNIRAALAHKSPRYFITTFGCQMNVRDSQTLCGLLSMMGYRPAKTQEQADFILINTCCVREHAEERVMGHLGALRFLKRENPELVIAICGCMMQQEHMAKKVRGRFPHVDMIFGTSAMPRFAQSLWEVLSSRKRVFDIRAEDIVVENLPAKRENPASAFVNIMYGCNNFCTYCIVPYVRGRERSRQMDKILNETRALVSQGVKEITFLGQNVNSYGKGLEDSPTFANLLLAANAIEGLERIRFMTSHPKDVSPALVAALRDCERVCKHIHLPVQSGSTRILRAMNRGYTREHYLDLVKQLRRAVPDIEITTDIIVGFPGESEEDFMQTLELVQAAGFSAAYTFAYSKREGTKAAAMPDQVPADIMKQRLARLNDAVQKHILESAPDYIGKRASVLVEGVREEKGGLLYGRTQGIRMVHLEGPKELVGSIVPVEIHKAEHSLLIARRVNDGE